MEWLFITVSTVRLRDLASHIDVGGRFYTIVKNRYVDELDS